MSGTRAYLDHNASSPLRPSALAAMQDALTRHGNASSVHGEGRDLRRLVETARAQVAELVGVQSDSVVFTASATEAAHLGLTPDVTYDGKLRRAEKLLVLETEHPCILTGGRFAQEDVIAIPVQGNGLIDLAELQNLLAGMGGIVTFVAVQLVNSESGIIQPIAEIARIVKNAGGYFLCDAVQAAGRMPIDAAQSGADFLILSAHKIGGPQGAGALINVHPILGVPAAIKGGWQEKNLRAGTENVAAIAGFGAAAVEAKLEVENYSSITSLRDSIEDRLIPICASIGLADRLTIFGADSERAGNTLLFSLEGLKAETALIAFDLEGVAVSSGSACSSGKVGASHVLKAMDVAQDVARGAIRVSLGWNSTGEDVEQFLKAFKRIARKLGERLETRISGAA